tara:strand:+ start:1905 stop:2192 length:288 start_codon:yes stop_codon:yes gene_type:complete
MGDLLDQTITENKLLTERDVAQKEYITLVKDHNKELQTLMKKQEVIISGFIKKTFHLAVTEEKYNIMREFITMCDLEDNFKTYLDSVELAFMFDD